MTSVCVALIDYGSGNLRSATKACEHVLSASSLRGRVILARNKDDLASASHIILPGVGAFADCLRGLGGLNGDWLGALTREVKEKGKAFLGICVGMQLLAEKSFEFGEHEGLGWFDGVVRPFESSGLKVPHMGWNNLHWTSAQARAHPLASGLNDGMDVYFVHSYRFAETNRGQVLCESDYGGTFPSLMLRDNILGSQFHPEKSQRVGLRLLTNFLSWRL